LSVWRVLAAVLLVLSWLLTVPLPATAQQRPRPPVRFIAAVGDCISDELGDALTEKAYTEELSEGWRIVVMLRGQPASATRGQQSPPPTEDAVAAVDIYQILPEEPVPDFVDNMSAFLMVNERDNQRLVVEIAGFYWLRLRTVAGGCIERSTGGLFTFQPMP
jgi:hypothetical protein